MEFSPEQLRALAGVQAEKAVSLATEYGARVVGALIVILLALWFAGRVKKWTIAALERAKIDATLARFFAQTARWVVLIFAGISILGLFGIQTASFAAVIAASGLAIGLAFQGTLANIASGVMLLIFRPFRAGQFVKVAGESGTVHEIDLFSTHLDTPDNRRIILPNSKVFGASLENVSYHATRRVDVAIGVAYDADLDETRALLLDIAKSTENVLQDPEPVVVLTELGASSVDWAIRAWVTAENYWAVRERLLVASKKALDAKSIGIPFPQMDVHLYRTGAETGGANAPGNGRDRAPAHQ